MKTAHEGTALVWFRRDLRLADNPALNAAMQSCRWIIPIYIDSRGEEGRGAPGAASRWWLHHSLEALSGSLQACGSRLIIRQGESLAVISELLSQTGATHLFWNRIHEPDLQQRDAHLADHLQGMGVQTQSFNASLLYEPWQLLKGDGKPYRVFTPYWKAMQQRGLPFALQPPPSQLPAVDKALHSLSLDSLSLLPRHGWDEAFHHSWLPGEAGAWSVLERFLDDTVDEYSHCRDIPARNGTSTLSPHLHYGEIGPRQILAAVQQHAGGTSTAGVLGNTEAYLRQLAWREFAYYLLYHFPHTVTQPFDPRFERFEWNPLDDGKLRAWQQGRTGIPIVDAGMRQLWHTGWMHNRVRMIVASLLTKNLLLPWQLGADWFKDTLVDADLAANTLGWQWTAGCGADAAPFFRIFNPVLQGQKFDPGGHYVRQWVPELNNLPDNYIHRPWEAPTRQLREAGVELGGSYPPPLLDLKQSRGEALERFSRIKARQSARQTPTNTSV